VIQEVPILSMEGTVAHAKPRLITFGISHAEGALGA
jgi:hypothetical protein